MGTSKIEKLQCDRALSHYQAHFLQNQCTVPAKEPVPPILCNLLICVKLTGNMQVNFSLFSTFDHLNLAK